MVSIINNISKSLSVELTKFLSKFCPDTFGSKQSFSAARYKIKWEAFVELNDVLVRNYYELPGYELWLGKYLLLATDGSDYEVPWGDETCAEFGIADNVRNKQPMCMAKAVKLWDVLNRLTISSELGRYDVAENQHFKVAWQKALDLLAQRHAGQILLLGDMHYPAFWLFFLLQSTSSHFLFRCPPDFCREICEFMTSGLQEAVLTVPISKDRFRKHAFKKKSPLQAQVPDFLKFRALRFVRPNGELTCLITSLPAEELPYRAACQLYPLRWGEETSFNYDKNRVEIENFSAKMPQGIRQDWHAGILAGNMAQIIIQDAQAELDEVQKNQKNKYNYQINRSVVLGIIKDEIPAMLLGQETPSQFYQRMLILAVKFKEPIRPNRAFPRIRKHRLRFSMNLRRVV